LGEDAPAGGRLTYLATVARAQGDLPAAMDYFERARQHFASAGDISGVAAAIHGLGDVALEEGKPKQALACYGEALEQGWTVATPWDLAYFLAGIAAACAALGRLAEAARLWGAVERLDAELEIKLDRSVYEEVLGDLDPREKAVGAELGNQEAVGLARRLSRASD
jgi:tetratricopeptide (TPR) repeat protein